MQYFLLTGTEYCNFLKAPNTKKLTFGFGAFYFEISLL